MCCIPNEIPLFDISIPVPIKNDGDYYKVLSYIFDEYCKRISQAYPSNCELVLRIHKNIEDIKNAVEEYLKNHTGEAKTLIKSLIKRYADKKFFVSEFNDSYAFRGISTQEDQQKTFGRDKTHKEHYQEMQKAPISLFRGRIFEHDCTSIGNPTAEDMLHIPFDLREKVATERYSMAGIPCLYLATTTLGCYLELNKPSFDEFYVSSYKVNNNNNIKLLNLCITQSQIAAAFTGCYVADKDDKLKEAEYLENLISIFPLVIASSFVVEDKAKRSFKTE